MAKGKLKLLYLMRIFMEETDDSHALTMQEIIARLAAFDIRADRKTLYSDFEELRQFGFDILSEQRAKNTYYHLGAREFELPELKLLVDSVQAAKFITTRKSRALIHKLEGLVSRHQAAQLHRQVFIAGRVKSMNESIYYNVDRLHEAINAGVQIRFQYGQWNVRKELELRRGGAWYQVSPWALTWYNENYYLVAYDAETSSIRHYRVEKMLHIRITSDARLGEESFRSFDMAKYTRSVFGMFAGEPTAVTFEAENHMAGVMIDRFGKDIHLVSVSPTRFRTTVSVVISVQFVGWVVGLGRDVRIVAPQSAVERMREEVLRLRQQYE